MTKYDELLGNIEPKVEEILNKNIKNKQGSHYMAYVFTLNNYSMIEYDNIVKLSKSLLIKSYVFGMEIGEECGTPHIQGYFHLKKKPGMRFTQFKEFLNNERIWFEQAKGNEAHNLKYCGKDKNYESNIEQPFKPDVLLSTELRPFQIEIEKICLGPVNKSKIIWIYDTIGQTGKTQFMKYMDVEHGSRYTYGGRVTDIMNHIFNNKKYFYTKGIKSIFFNFCREVKMNNISYVSLEMVADGCCSNTKFECNQFSFNSPHIIVLANNLPAFDKMTFSRWIVYTINKNFELLPFDIRAYKHHDNLDLDE